MDTTSDEDDDQIETFDISIIIFDQYTAIGNGHLVEVHRHLKRWNVAEWHADYLHVLSHVSSLLVLEYWMEN